MPQLKAIHEVIRDGKNGKPEAIAPGSPFTADQALADMLIANGAAALVDTTEEVKETKGKGTGKGTGKTDPKPGAAETPADDDSLT